MATFVAEPSVWRWHAATRLALWRTYEEDTRLEPQPDTELKGS